MQIKIFYHSDPLRVKEVPQQTLQTQIRLLLQSSLIRVYTVCKSAGVFHISWDGMVKFFQFWNIALINMSIYIPKLP